MLLLELDLNPSFGPVVYCTYCVRDGANGARKSGSLYFPYLLQSMDRGTIRIPPMDVSTLCLRAGKE